MDVRSLQRPLKDRYRQEPTSSRITLTARGTQSDAPIACSVDLGRAIYNAQAHQGWRGGYRGLLRRPAVGCARRLCSDHLPNGSRSHGNTYRGH
jgi:hypothetical protein